MKHLRRIFLPLLLCLMPTGALRADFKTSQSADLVIGGIEPEGQVYASDIAIDTATQKVFVSDRYTHRVLRFSSQAALQNGGMAEAVFGAANFSDTTPGTSATELNAPQGICVDNGGRLWVADTLNNRVLRFDNALTAPSGAAASVVLGQPNFTSTITATQANRMNTPQDVEVDAEGRLWVADSLNERVLRFGNAASLNSGVNANAVLGKPNMTTEGSGLGDGGMDAPTGLAVEISGGATVRLWVVDWYNSRVLGYNNPGAKANGAAANKVLGQLNFDTRKESKGTGGMARPYKAAVENGGLWVADFINNRALYFANAGSKPNGGSADLVLGQPDFDTSTLQLDGPGGLYQPEAIAASAGRVWIGDTHRRIVRHDNAANKGNGTDAEGILGWKSFAPSFIGSATDIEIDSVTGKLFVADSANNRVLRYASTASLHAGSTPELVLGQPDLATTTGGVSASKMYGPSSLTLDALGNLWVSDTGNHRVLRFASAATITSNGEAAAQVLGQTTFTVSGSGLAANRFNAPRGLAVEWAFNANFQVVLRRLWVADRNNHRVLRFESPLTLGNGGAASGVLGAPNLTTAGNGSLTASGIKYPDALTVELGGTLWVADTGNERLLRFDAAVGKPNNGSADSVLFQTNFTTNNPATGTWITSLTPGANGRLYAARPDKKDIVWFDNAAAKANGASPDGTLGDPNVVNSTPGGSVAVDAAGRLWSGNGTTLMRYTPSLESSIIGFGFNPQNRFYLNILGTGGETYTIRSSTDLQNWSTIENTTTVPGNGTSSITWTAPAPPNGPKNSTGSSPSEWHRPGQADGKRIQPK